MQQQILFYLTRGLEYEPAVTTPAACQSAPEFFADTYSEVALTSLINASWELMT